MHDLSGLIAWSPVSHYSGNVSLQDLNCLIERYLEPLKEETFLTGDDIQQLFGNIREIVQFQRLFMQSLEDAVLIEPDFNILDNPKQFRVSYFIVMI